MSSEAVRDPLLFQVNTRVRLHLLGEELGRPATLDDIPDVEIGRLADSGFDLAYFLGVWKTGVAGLAVSRSRPEWREEFLQTLPDLRDDDICGSCFAITGYEVSERLGGDEALVRLRDRLHRRGLKLILDFVPNHTALDHPWVRDHPEYYVPGSTGDLAREPQNYYRVPGAEVGGGAAGGALGGVVGDQAGAEAGDPLILAYGRDPHFPGWPDALQLNYGEPAVQEAMLAELERVAGLCDGVRCDMAMLVMPDVFQWTWSIPAQPFWPKAIAKIKEKHPGFLFLAEVYWDLEWALQQQGFDYTYDKRLYDRLREGDAGAALGHLRADGVFQQKSARFLENHDEPRAAATFAPETHRAAAVVTFLCPGLRFFHQGQLEGARLRLPVHLCRAPAEPVDVALHEFYDRLLACIAAPAIRQGTWSLLECRPAWDGNLTRGSFIAYAWQGDGDQRALVVVNYSSIPGQCFVPLPFEGLEGRRWFLKDLLGDAAYYREGDDLARGGLYVDMPAWGRHVFALTH